MSNSISVTGWTGSDLKYTSLKIDAQNMPAGTLGDIITDGMHVYEYKSDGTWGKRGLISVPIPFTLSVNKENGLAQLTWEAQIPGVFPIYKIYRDIDPTFQDPDIIETTDTSWTDPDEDGETVIYYVVTVG